MKFLDPELSSNVDFMDAGSFTGLKKLFEKTVFVLGRGSAALGGSCGVKIKDSL